MVWASYLPCCVFKSNTVSVDLKSNSQKPTNTIESIPGQNVSTQPKSTSIMESNSTSFTQEPSSTIQSLPISTVIRPDLSAFTFSRVQGTQCTKLPNTIPKNVPFTIEDCKNAALFVMDISAQVTIDCCENTFILIAPCEGSVFIRDCHHCVIVAAAQQIRLKGCTDIKLSLYTHTQPVIETSSKIQIGCFRYAYPELNEQFRVAKFDVLNNVWHEVFDFNDTTGKNYQILKSPDEMDDWDIKAPTGESVPAVDTKGVNCPVPSTFSVLANLFQTKKIYIVVALGNSLDIIHDIILDIPISKIHGAKKIPAADLPHSIFEQAAQNAFTFIYIMATSQTPVEDKHTSQSGRIVWVTDLTEISALRSLIDKLPCN
ncbi:Protein Xrp2 [Batrachochytrium dendrobatidis]|nr:Protein Xrp2 [Batrachochytrium dendrobatidis]KAK5671755.1 Protein Xrp2 [Batrachochytrium dendrobatidis]